jgi:hypothetical protein
MNRPAYKGGQGKGAGGQERPLLAPLFFSLFLFSAKVAVTLSCGI